MDEALIRRLLGGVILLAIAWLVAALLPPPKPASEIDEETVVIDLRRAEPTPAPPARPAEPSNEAYEPIPTPAVPEADTPTSRPSPTAVPTPVTRVTPTPPPATPAATPTPAPTATPAPAPADAYWVQVGAYGTREGAEQVRASLEVAGLSSRVVSVTVGGKAFHRVRIGPLTSRTDAESAQARAVLLGYPNAQVTR